MYLVLFNELRAPVSPAALDPVKVEEPARAISSEPHVARAPLCTELPCRLRDPENLRRYLFKISQDRDARDATGAAFRK